MIRSTVQLMLATALGATMLALAGCHSYTLRGKVIQGATGGTELVHVMDQRLKGPGLANTEVLVHRDAPGQGKRYVGRGRSGAGGNFSVGMNEYGAGWMQEAWQVQAILHGYQTTSEMVKLPPKGSKWRLLITLAPGQSTPAEHDESAQFQERMR